jgi:hypothetical protein
MSAPHLETPLNYFVCTLGEAAELKNDKSTTYTTVNDLIDRKVCSSPDLPALAFPLPSVDGEVWGSQIYSEFVLPNAFLVLND